MKALRLILLFTIGFISLQVSAQIKIGNITVNTTNVTDDFYKDLNVDYSDMLAMKFNPKLISLLGSGVGANFVRNDMTLFQSQELWTNLVSADSKRTLDPIADYTVATQLPHKSKLQISALERGLLKAYLENPRDIIITEILAVYNLQKLYEENKAAEKKKTVSGQSIKYSVLSLYFLNRAKDLGLKHYWVTQQIQKVETALNKTLDGHGLADANETLDSVLYFRNSFTENEQNRYTALDKLLDQMVQYPENAFVNFYYVAGNTWNSGEEPYDEPGIMNNIILASYFSVRSIMLSEKIERKWDVDPINNVRFRLACITGGFSVFNRRWLAKLQGDTQSIPLLDGEHRLWYAHHKNFHAFTISATFFNEKENFPEALADWQDATFNCDPAQRTCNDTPLFSYNRLSFILGLVDHLLKAGNKDLASILLTLRNDPQFVYEGWTYGRASWEHRENNMDAIIAAYQDNNPDNDPSMFVLTKKKWNKGNDLMTCQECHQVQGRVWTDAQKAVIQVHADAINTIGVYPVITTKWYGSMKDQ